MRGRRLLQVGLQPADRVPVDDRDLLWVRLFWDGLDGRDFDPLAEGHAFGGDRRRHLAALGRTLTLSSTLTLTRTLRLTAT